MNIVKPVCRFLKRNGPLILTVTASAGVVATAVLTGKAVLKVDRLLEDIPEEKMKSKEIKLTVLKAYIPPVLTGIGTIACIIGAHCINRRIQVGLVAAYGMVDSAFKSYRSKIDSDIDTVAMSEVREEQILAHVPDVLDQKPCGIDGVRLWYIDGRKHPFFGTEADVWKGVHNLNKQIFEPTMHKGYATLDEFLGVMPWVECEETDSIYGWSSDDLICERDCYMLEPFWNENGTWTDPCGNVFKCYILEFNIPPIIDFLDYPKSC